MIDDAMTEADHADLSRRLALAIGWPEYSIIVTDGAYVWWHGKWRIFDYRDPLVIWPIAERYRMFPHWMPLVKKWATKSIREDGSYANLYFANTAAEAVARAVIGGAG